MEKERHRGTSRLQFSKEEQMQAVRAGQPERSHSPLLHQGIHAAHANSIIRRQKPMKMRTALCKPR